jgi:hypothetical protein
VLLEHGFDLGEEVVLASALAVREQRAGGEDEERRKEANDHGPIITT